MLRPELLLPTVAVVMLFLPTGVCAQADPLAGYELIEPAEPLPQRPWHTTFVREDVATPPGRPNAGADWLHYFLERSFANQLQTTAAQSPWETAPGFLAWAVWGYLAADSRYRGEERLLEMAQVWLDRLFADISTPPADPEQARAWKPNTLDSWNLHEYTIPLLEILARPQLQARLGEERIARLRETVLENIRENATPEAYNSLLDQTENYVNPALHAMAVFVHGWLLTGERKYLLMAYRIVHILGRDQLANGTFPYRLGLHGERHYEWEPMYYHNINVRGLYLYWWATGSREAEEIFRRSVPYYPLSMEPPWFYNGGPDIWWKDQWRTFWPHHIAMVAAVTGDGENARLAGDMARDRVSFDRVDLVLGAHAYLQMGLRGVAEQPLRDNYLLQDPDIRGVRLRFGHWSATFTAGSFTYTRASAMSVAEDLRSYAALHLARPVVRLAPLEQAQRTEDEYHTLGGAGAEYSFAGGERAAVAATAYRPARTAATWQPVQPLAPWQMREVWLLTDRGAVGLLDSLSLEANQARELCHQFRFIPPVRGAEGEAAGDSLWAVGDLRFRVWATDLEHTIFERARRYALGERDRSDWQVALSDTDRSPEHVAQDPPGPGEEPPALRLPELREYPPGYRRFSLVEVYPAGGEPGAEAERVAQGEVLGFRVQQGERGYLALFNPSEQAASFATAVPLRAASFSWAETADLPPLEQGARTLSLPPGGAALLVW